MTTAATTPRLSLRRFVAANLAEGETDYRAEALRLVDSIEPADRDEYLAQAIMIIVSEINGQRRREAFDALDLHSQPAEGSGHGSSVNQTCPALPSAPPLPNTARTDAHREFWLELRDTIGLSAEGGRKRVGDMTAADLRANIEHRQKLASENLQRAEQFRQLLALLEASGAHTVDEMGGLP